MSKSTPKLKNVLNDIAEAIRLKKQTTTKYCPLDYADEIASIESGTEGLGYVLVDMDYVSHKGSIFTSKQCIMLEDYSKIKNAYGYTIKIGE